MAILERAKLNPQQRFDLEDWEVTLAALRSDSQLWHKKVFSATNKIVAGFVVSGLGTATATVTMTGATLLIPESTGEFSYYTAPTGAPAVGVTGLTSNTRNYLEMSLSDLDGTPVAKAFWDPDGNDGAGAEFNQTVNSTTTLDVEFNVTTSGFTAGGNYVPIAIIDVTSGGLIELIFDQRAIFGRLAIPSDIDNDYAWGTKQEPTYTATLSGQSGTFDASGDLAVGGETATWVSGATTPVVFQAPTGTNFSVGDTLSQASGGGATGTIVTVVESFTGVDKSLTTVESIFKALMTEIKAIKGTRFWWTNASIDLESIAINLDVPNQDRNMALVEGGVWDLVDNAGTYELTNSANAYLAIGGLTQGRNRILAQQINLPNATSVAYITLNRDTGIDSTRTVTVADVDDVVLTDYVTIIARRTTTGVWVGPPGAEFFVAEDRASSDPIIGISGNFLSDSGVLVPNNSAANLTVNSSLTDNSTFYGYEKKNIDVTAGTRTYTIGGLSYLWYRIHNDLILAPSAIWEIISNRPTPLFLDEAVVGDDTAATTEGGAGGGGGGAIYAEGGDGGDASAGVQPGGAGSVFTDFATDFAHTSARRGIMNSMSSPSSFVCQDGITRAGCSNGAAGGAADVRAGGAGGSKGGVIILEVDGNVYVGTGGKIKVSGRAGTVGTAGGLNQGGAGGGGGGGAGTIILLCSGEVLSGEDYSGGYGDGRTGFLEADGGAGAAGGSTSGTGDGGGGGGGGAGGQILIICQNADAAWASADAGAAGAAGAGAPAGSAGSAGDAGTITAIIAHPARLK